MKNQEILILFSIGLFIGFILILVAASKNKKAELTDFFRVLIFSVGCLGCIKSGADLAFTAWNEPGSLGKFENDFVFILIGYTTFIWLSIVDTINVFKSY